MSDCFEKRLQRLTVDITAPATAHEARWTLAALRRVDPEIGARLDRQIGLWLEAARTGDEDEIELQGGGLARGYRKAAEIMQAADAEDDSYLLGHDAASGLTLAIGHSPASAEAVKVNHGPDAVWMTPDEVAGLLQSLGGFETIAAIKRAWPEP
ncbi:hypothetical protein [Methylobacterium soli]|uniref:Uncharacterized protein n=1 Tax=Methylobacterium soli TaxID=553447 RepID=A0A6L3SN76_9HYPH|nr:hypothetical protein [Methylobacterium soli]KAB1068132.1 hypothetical protein F6X53_31835 [Methylobacterium soli]GJE45684.1 hypothetical protein AEGHOMDF_4884 [Methylobacterium soli]